jgi:hypothetical protein
LERFGEVSVLLEKNSFLFSASPSPKIHAFIYNTERRNIKAVFSVAKYSKIWNTACAVLRKVNYFLIFQTRKEKMVGFIKSNFGISLSLLP